MLMNGFDSHLDIQFLADTMSFAYGPGVFGPQPEMRRLDAIRSNLLDSKASGPDPVYSIVMDVGRERDRQDIVDRSLLFGVVAYAAGQIGAEVVRSQGHVHAVDAHSGWSTPELIEVWQGTALVYLQEFVEENPGRCVAVEARVGELVVIPPGWAHYIANADAGRHMVFGAWCTRDYGFDYSKVRAFRGLGWFSLHDAGRIAWVRNPAYGEHTTVETKRARSYPELGLRQGVPIYQQFTDNPDSVQWVSDPARYANVWKRFEP
jgi:glucose-6-phosphate isomerase